MIPELTDANVALLSMIFLDLNVILAYPITLTTFVGYSFPTDEAHPEPWGKQAGRLRCGIESWIDDQPEGKTHTVTSKKGKLTYAWKDPLKVAALRAKHNRHVGIAKDFVLEYTRSRLPKYLD